MRNRLLVVDDDLAVRKQLRWGLASAFDVTEAATADEAMTAFREVGPAVVTLDVCLDEAPGTPDGMSLLREMLRLDPSVKVVMVTADGDEHNATRALEIGAWDYYVKPIETKELSVIALRAAHIRRLQGVRGPRTEYAIDPLDFSTWLGDSTVARRVQALLTSLAPLSTPVMLLGEPGTGRDLAAQALAALSGDASPMMVEGRSATLERRSPDATRPLYVDGVHELSAADQTRLAEWMQRGEIGRLIVSAFTDVGHLAARGRLDRGLFHELATATIVLPPLRERPDDVGTIADRLVSTYARRFRDGTAELSPEARVALIRHRWPGNLRELERRLLGAVLTSRSDLIQEEDLWPSERPTSSGSLKANISELERTLVEQALIDSNGNVSQAARELDVSRPTLHALLRKHGIDPKPYREAAGA